MYYNSHIQQASWNMDPTTALRDQLGQVEAAVAAVEQALSSGADGAAHSAPLCTAPPRKRGAATSTVIHKTILCSTFPVSAQLSELITARDSLTEALGSTQQPIFTEAPSSPPPPPPPTFQPGDSVLAPRPLEQRYALAEIRTISADGLIATLHWLRPRTNAWC